MIITTPALAAAFRLRTQHPVTVRTHTREYEDMDPTGRIAPRFTAFRRDRIRRMLAEGMTKKQMAVELGVTTTSVRRHLKVIKAEQKKARQR